jgi:hypothetical protein
VAFAKATSELVGTAHGILAFQTGHPQVMGQYFTVLPTGSTDCEDVEGFRFTPFPLPPSLPSFLPSLSHFVSVLFLMLLPFGIRYLFSYPLSVPSLPLPSFLSVMELVTLALIG